MCRGGEERDGEGEGRVDPEGGGGGEGVRLLLLLLEMDGVTACRQRSRGEQGSRGEGTEEMPCLSKFKRP